MLPNWLNASLARLFQRLRRQRRLNVRKVLKKLCGLAVAMLSQALVDWAWTRLVPS